MIFREVEKIQIQKKLRKKQNFQKIVFFAIRNLMNLAGVQHEIYDTSSLRRKAVHTFIFFSDASGHGYWCLYDKVLRE